MKPDHAQAYINRGILLNAAGDLKGALTDCNAALELRPRSYRWLTLRGEIKEKLGDFEGAVEDYDRSLELAPAEWRERLKFEQYRERAKAKLSKGE